MVDEPELIDGKYVVRAYGGKTVLRFGCYETAKECLDGLKDIKARESAKYRFSGAPYGLSRDELPERTQRILDLIDENS